MQFEWDEEKEKLNRIKHKVSFDDAKEIFEYQTTIFIQDEIVDGEERWKAVGTINGYRFLLVIHTYHADNGDEYIRIISARLLGKNEVKGYGDY